MAVYWPFPALPSRDSYKEVMECSDTVTRSRPGIGRVAIPRARKIIGCEALESRQLLSRGMGAGALGGIGLGGRAMSSQTRSWARSRVGAAGAMFGSGNLGLGGAARNPTFLLTASLLNAGGGTTSPPSRSVLSSSAVQAAFQTLQTDFSNDVTAGSKPTHASVGQLKDDLKSIRNGKLTGDAATTAIQNDETAILTSMGLTSSQVSQILSDVEGVQSAIEPAPGSGSASAADRRDDHGDERAGRWDVHGAYGWDDATGHTRDRLSGAVGVPDSAIRPEECLTQQPSAVERVDRPGHG